MNEVDLAQVSARELDSVSSKPTNGPTQLTVRAEGTQNLVEIERCRSGRLRYSYPVGEHDMEIRLPEDVPPSTRTRLLARLADAVEVWDPLCRRIVVATDVEDLEALSAAEEAGFRHIVDVDLREAAYCLSVREPPWVIDVDMDLDHIPGT